MIDWLQFPFLIPGMSLGAYIGYRINCWRVRTDAPGARDFAKHAEEPARAALLIGLAAFAGCAIAYDGVALMKEPKPEMFVLKYLFAVVMSSAHYLFLKRVARESAAT